MPSYYAVIPASVRYDKNLIPHAKLLYGEITALCNEKGFCWAGNTYFSELYGVSNRSITSWVASLVNGGYIKCEVRYKAGSREVESRKISITPPIEENFYTPMEENFHTYRRKLPDPIEENFLENTTVNNTINNKESIVKKPVENIQLPFSGEDFKKAWDDWIGYRKERKLPKYTERGLQKTFKHLTEISGQNESSAIKIIEQSMSNNWQGMFALKPNYSTAPKGNYQQQVEDAKKRFKLVQE